MPTTTNPRTEEELAAQERRRQRWLLALALGLFVVTGYFVWQHFRGPAVAVETVANRPLLKRDRKEVFHDAAAGVRFMPPTNWSLQAATTEAPDHHRKERLIAKFKRLLPNQTAAWLRVYVADAAADASIVAAVGQRKPPPGFTTLGKAQSMNLAGAPAAKITYSGKYNNVLSVHDIVGVHHNQQHFFFISTYPALDQSAHQQTMEAIRSIVFEQ